MNKIKFFAEAIIVAGGFIIFGIPGIAVMAVAVIIGVIGFSIILPFFGIFPIFEEMIRTFDKIDPYKDVNPFANTDETTNQGGEKPICNIPPRSKKPCEGR